MSPDKTPKTPKTTPDDLHRQLDYLNLPFMGSSSVRGTLGMIGDAALNPTYYFSIPIAVSVGEGSLKTLNTTSLHIEEYDGLMDATLDPYVAARSAYYEDKSKLTEQ